MMMQEEQLRLELIAMIIKSNTKASELIMTTGIIDEVDKLVDYILQGKRNKIKLI